MGKSNKVKHRYRLKPKYRIKLFKPYFGYTTRLILFSFLLILLLLISFACFIKANYSTVSKSLAYFKISDADYKVYLKDNDYYETNVLPSNMEYIASLIDYFDINFIYQITTTENINTKYKYYIEAVIKVYGDTEKSNIVFEKKKKLTDEKVLNYDNSNTSIINEKIFVDYDEYNELISSFKSSYALNSTSDVTIILHVSTLATSDNIEKDIVLKDDASISIPLTKQTINIGVVKNRKDDYKVVKGKKKYVFSDITHLIASLFMLILFLIHLIRYIIWIKKCKIGKTSYEKKLNKILTEYDAIIVNIKNNFDDSKYEIIAVDSFEELKDAHDNTGNPIIYVNIHPKQKSYFMLIKDNLLYRYVLKSADLKKK